MKTSSNALSCSAECFSLCASAWPSVRLSSRTTTSAPPRASCPNCLCVIGYLLSVGDAGREDLIAAGAGVVRRVREDVLAPHHVLVVHLRPARVESSPAHAVIRIARVHAHHRLGEDRDALRRVGPGP